MGDEIVSIEQAASEAGIPVHIMLGWMCDSGALMVPPEHLDPRCWAEAHIPDCGCVFVALHPDVQEIDGAAR
jgi:hypothetical protein